jgi:hypothetical protein
MPYSFNDVTLVVLQIHTFSDLPHLCVREIEGVREMTLYVRNEKNESAPVRTRDDTNQIIEQAVRNRHDRLLESFRSVAKPFEHGQMICKISCAPTCITFERRSLPDKLWFQARTIYG